HPPRIGQLAARGQCLTCLINGVTPQHGLAVTKTILGVRASATSVLPLRFARQAVSTSVRVQLPLAANLSITGRAAFLAAQPVTERHGIVPAYLLHRAVGSLADTFVTAAESIQALGRVLLKV